MVCKVIVLDPLLPGILDGVNVTASPVSFVLESDTVAANPFAAVDVISMLAVPPTSTFKVEFAACSVKLEGCVTVTVIGAVCVTPSPLAVTVRTYTPGTTVASGANARVLVPEPGAATAAGVKLGCRPAGGLPPADLASDSATAELNPVESADMVTLAAALEPWPIVRDGGVTLSVKAGGI